MAEPCRLSLGLSPCPNDTFIFHALLAGDLPGGILDGLEIEPVFADVQRLNEMAMEGRLSATKVSAGALPRILDRYGVLSSGGALGFGCGPLVVGKRPMSPREWARATVAIPGEQTTASLLLDLHGGFGGRRRPMVFSEVMDAVLAGECELGVIIHEGRFTYARRGLVRQLDLGEWWEGDCGLPLPLGLIAVRRDIPADIAVRLERAIRLSLARARQNPAPALDFCRLHAQELDDEVMRAHIDTFVTRFSDDLGPEGRDAVRGLVLGRGGAARRAIFLGE